MLGLADQFHCHWTVFRRTTTPEGQNKQPGKCCRAQGITVKIANLTEFQKPLPVVEPGFCLNSCCVSPLGQGQLLLKGALLWHHFLRRNAFYDDGFKDAREVPIIQVSLSRSHYHILQTIPSKRNK